jgi:hypothetical protein
MNEQSRDTGMIGHTRHRMKTNKTQKHNTKNKKYEQNRPHQKPGVTKQTPPKTGGDKTDPTKNRG